MTVNICSETEIFNIHGEGVSTSFATCVELLQESNDVQIYINNEKIGDVMHCHTYGPYYFWRGRKYKGKRIHTAHVIPDSAKGTFPGWKFLMPFFKWYLKKVYSFSDVCIAISPMVEKAIKELSPNTTVVNISNPILLDTWKRTPELRQKGREILGLKDDDFCVMCVGQLENRKGCEDFVNIGRQIPEAQFRWIGGRPFGIYTDGYWNINKQMNTAPNNVQFSGIYSLSKMPYLYAAGDLFIFPSYQENCPLSPLEAAASGMPVIFRNLEEYKLLYKNEYLKADNNDDFINAITTMQYNKSAHQKGLKISKDLIAQFDKNVIRKQLVELYNHVNNSSTNSKDNQNIHEKLKANVEEYPLLLQ